VQAVSRKILTSLLAAAIAVGATSVAAAAPAEDRVSVRVPIADLNLQSEAGARVALRRITNAAGSICGDEADTRDLRRQALFQACVRHVVGEAVAAADSPMLAALNGTPMRSATLAAVN
jgi:UrcA family protein